MDVLSTETSLTIFFVIVHNLDRNGLIYRSLLGEQNIQFKYEKSKLINKSKEELWERDSVILSFCLKSVI